MGLMLFSGNSWKTLHYLELCEILVEQVNVYLWKKDPKQRGYFQKLFSW